MAIDPRQIADVSGALKQLEGFGEYKTSIENRLSSLESGGVRTGGSTNSGSSSSSGGGTVATPKLKTTVTTLAAGSQATANVSTSGDTWTFSFGIPVGETGATGQQGPKGETGATGQAGRDGTDGKDGDSGKDGSGYYEENYIMDKQDGIWPGNTGYADTFDNYVKWKKSQDGNVVVSLGMDYATGVKIYGFSGTEEEWNQAVASIAKGDDSEDVTKCWSYGMKPINISTHQPPESPTPGYATMWQVKGTATQEYSIGGTKIGDGTAVGITVNSTTNDVGFMLAAGYYGLYYRHKVGNSFGNRIARWGLLKDRYGFTVDSRNITCARICSWTEGETEDVVWKKFWLGVENGVSSGILEGGSGGGSSFVATDHWFYIALKFCQTDAYNSMYRMQYTDDDWRRAIGRENVPDYINRDVNGAYDGYGILLGWIWERPIWWVSAMGPNGDRLWGGTVDMGKLAAMCPG